MLFRIRDALLHIEIITMSLQPSYAVVQQVMSHNLLFAIPLRTVIF